MVTVPQDQPASGPKGLPNNPPYPMSPMSETRRPVVQRATKPTASSSKAPTAAAPNAHPDSESDWEKDGMDDDDDWEIADKPSDATKPSSSEKPKEVSKAALPASLRAGPPPGAPIKKMSAENMLAVSSQISPPISSIAGSSKYGSQVSLPQPTPPSAVAPEAIHPPSSYAVPSRSQGPAASAPLSQSGYPPTSGYPPNSGYPPVSGYPMTSGYTPQQVTATTTPEPEAAPIKKQSTGEKLFGVESSPQWQARRPAQVTYDAAVELPTTHTPVDEYSRLNLGPASPESTQPSLIPVESEFGDRSNLNRHESNASSHWNPGADISTFDAMTSRGQRLPSDAIATPSKTWQEQQDWERAERESREVEAAIALENAKQEEQMRRAEEEWHQGEIERREREQEESISDYSPPTLPDGTPMPPPPPRPPPTTEQLPRSAMRQAPEHYAIKQVRWYDAQSGKLRQSPILIQNANGPCPLLALVNALILSTPESDPSGLVETLRTREQVSLNLVLDAVFDELTSGRRGGATQNLPDVGELYEFLKNLHTGMNVNPRFTYLPDRQSRELHPAYRPTEGPGGFEETKEMTLYSTFNVPLVHGWIPPRESPSYKAFQRSAKTYEDAQNIQFHEEEFEHKLSTSGLTPQEQETFEDLHTIKAFLETWPTQLTDTGLQTLLDHIKPGSFCILFRNDHFSTIFKEPKANQLLTLVTDSGYATHDEIVWESLVDVSGQGSELFSGDFRPVSHNTQSGPSSGPPAGPRGSSLGGGPQNIQSMLDVDDNSSGAEWSTVQRGRGRNSQHTSNNNNSLAGGATPQPQTDSDIARAEQEDHDLALALQLQEEEEARARRETEARQRENVFEPGRNTASSGTTTNVPVTGPGSNNNSSGNNPPARPPRNNNNSNNNQSQNRPTVPPRRAGRNSGELPPPTYEQAASRPAFVPPGNHPLNPVAPVPGTAGGNGSSSNYQQQQQQQQWGAPQQQQGMGRGGNNMGPYGRGREHDREKCVVM